jgi:oxygen-independent coproporphyrinogen-3 oxidase
MNEASLEKHAAPVPRYTSYPTAPHFHDGIGAESYAQWLGALPTGANLSAYVHIPYCDTLCWFCGCHTKITRRHAPVATYLDALRAEIEIVASHIDASCQVSHIHWGGGSPTLLQPGEITALAGHLKGCLPWTADAEFAVEIDPRGVDTARLDGLAEAGVTRASIGIQDLNDKVQTAINRVQPFEETAEIVAGLRQRGIGSINFDLMYGLPHQTVQRVEHTVAKCLELKPDRIALFGYAHVPWMKKHQRLIDEAELPGLAGRFEQSQAAADMLEAHGYARIGLDHFARRDDRLAIAAGSGTLRRNFQGYTSDAADALIGFGASAIGSMPDGYVQNNPAIHEYESSVWRGDLPVVRGIAFSGDDLARRRVIEQLMCDFGFDTREVVAAYGADARPVLADAAEFARDDADGLVRYVDGHFSVTAAGRPFVRSICARFDTYLRKANARHSLAV